MFVIQIKPNSIFFFPGFFSWIFELFGSLLEAGASLFCHVSSLSVTPIISIYDAYIQNIRARCDI